MRWTQTQQDHLKHKLNPIRLALVTQKKQKGTQHDADDIFFLTSLGCLVCRHQSSLWRVTQQHILPVLFLFLTGVDDTRALSGLSLALCFVSGWTRRRLGCKLMGAAAGVFCPLSASTKETERHPGALMRSRFPSASEPLGPCPNSQGTMRYDGSSFRKVIFRGRCWQQRRPSDFGGSLAEFHAPQCDALHSLIFQINWINVHYSQSLEMLWHFVCDTRRKYVCPSRSFAFLSLIAMRRSLRLCLLFQERRTAMSISWERFSLG